MIRGYKGLSKQFVGSVYVNLEDPNIIFYIANGDFYNNGSTTYKFLTPLFIFCKNYPNMKSSRFNKLKRKKRPHLSDRF